MKLAALTTPVLAAWALSSGLGSCSTPVTCYAPAQLLPAGSAPRLAGSRLCRGLGTEWDSALVLVAYKAPAFIRAAPVGNYGAVRGPVAEQAFNEETATLLLAKNGRYTAYCVFSKDVDWLSFVNAKAPRTQVAWLTPGDCALLGPRPGLSGNGQDRRRRAVFPSLAKKVPFFN